MKKLIVVVFLFIYLASFLKPFFPAIYNFISKNIWECSHKSRVEKMGGRVHFLTVLADIAKHNNANHDSNPVPDGTKSVNSTFSFIVPNLNCSICSNEVLVIFFPNFIFNNEIIFKQNTTPPPKRA